MSQPLNIAHVQGAIFDIDDTLLDNQPTANGRGLHEISRLAAVHEVGRELDIPRLQTITEEENYLAFLDAKAHTLVDAVWNILRQADLVTTEVIEPEHEILQRIVRLKNALHITVLRDQGREVPGATHFVRALAVHGLSETLGIASMGMWQDIKIFLSELTDLDELFPEHRIIHRDLIVRPKPHPEAFNLAFASLGLPESARPYVLAFEDDPRGIMAAQAAGLFVCAITTRYSRDQLAALAVSPHLIANSFAEFETMFQLNP